MLGRVSGGAMSGMLIAAVSQTGGILPNAALDEMADATLAAIDDHARLLAGLGCRDRQIAAYRTGALEIVVRALCRARDAAT